MVANAIAGSPAPATPASVHASVVPGGLVVALYAALVYLPFLGSSRTLTSHEVMVTQPALRLLAGDGWIVPRYTSGLWLDKPPLDIWLTAGSFALCGGFSEFAARLPAAVSAIGLCLVVYVLARRAYGARAALFAGLVQATCVYMYMQGRLGEVDLPFTLVLAGAQATLAWCWSQGPRRLPLGAAALFYFLVGLAVLTKGGLGVVFPGMTVLTYCVLERSWMPLRATLFTPAILVFVGVVAPWHVAAYLTAGQEALDEWQYNTLLRFLGLHRLGGARSPLFYLWTVVWLMAPWTLVLAGGAPALWRQASRPQAAFERLLWSWFLGGLVFLTICIFKHAHYILPALPPLAILAGQLLDMLWQRVGRHERRLLIGVWAALPVVFGIVGGAVLPARDHRRETVDWVRRATADVPAGEPLLVIGLGQSSVYPYIAHDEIAYLDSPDALQTMLGAHAGRSQWVLSARRLIDMADRLDLAFTEVSGERPRENHPVPETLVLGRLSARTPTTP